jgi:hypothetical protein
MKTASRARAECFLMCYNLVASLFERCNVGVSFGPPCLV